MFRRISRRSLRLWARLCSFPSGRNRAKPIRSTFARSADWTIRPRLLTIQGIAQIINIGGGVKQYQVLVTPEKLKQFGITIEEVASALEKSNSNSTGGFVDAQSQEYLVRNLARFYSVDELKNTVVVYRNNTAIKVGDVADVEFGAKIKRGDAGSNGTPAVIMSIQKQPGASTLELTEKIDTALAELQANLPEDIEVNANLFRQANFIDTQSRTSSKPCATARFLSSSCCFCFC